MIRKVLLTIAFFAAASVLAAEEISYKDLLTQNNANSNSLKLGMTKSQVVGVMKNYTSRVHNTPISNPYRAEVFQRGSNSFEILYYLNRPHAPFTALSDSRAIPVVLKNGHVVGWGPIALQGVK